MAAKPLSDDDVADVIKARLDTSVGGSTSALMKARSRAVKFYTGQEPKPLHKGNSSFVSRDVFDAVEGRKASLLEGFTGNARPVRFAPNGPDDVVLAQQATDYTDYVIFRQNNGYQVMHDVIHDGLLASVGVVQVWWRNDVQSVEYELTNQTSDAAMELLVQHRDKLEDWDAGEPNEDGLIDLTFTLREDRSCVCIETVPPEEFGLSNHAVDLDSSNIVWRKQIKSIAELRQEGIYDDALLDKLADSAVGVSEDYETAERFSEVDNGTPFDDNSDKGRKLIEVYDCYAQIDVDGTGQTDLWHVVYAESMVLAKEKVSRHPFLAYVPMRLPHRFYGDNFAASVIPIQIANTMLTRTVIDHALITTNPRYQVVRGGLVNPRELIENRLGGIVNITRPDAIMPMQQPALSPMVFQTMEKMEALKESITGTSDLQQGLSKDALSNQNSADLVQQMATLGQTRAKIMARNFAEFMRELFLSVYQLVIENETQQHVMSVAGEWVTVDPTKWDSRSLVTVEFALGYGEQDKEAMELVQYDEVLSADPSMAPIYTIQERYNVWHDVLMLKRRYDVGRYLKNPATVPPQQPSQQQIMQAQLAEREMAVKEKNADATLIKAQSQATGTQSKVQTASVGNALKVGQQALKVQQFKHQQEVDMAEIGLQAHANYVSAQARPVAVQPRAT